MDVPGGAWLCDFTDQGNPRGMRRLMTLQIAYRNFTRNSRRFLLLGIAVSAGFLFLCVAQGLVAAFSLQINLRGARYYGGHANHQLDTADAADVAQAEEDSLILGAVSRQVSIHPRSLTGHATIQMG